MENTNKALDTRYKALVIELKCDKCGIELSAEGESDDFKAGINNSIIVQCPHCHNEISATSDVAWIDEDLVDYILHHKK